MTDYTGSDTSMTDTDDYMSVVFLSPDIDNPSPITPSSIIDVATQDGNAILVVGPERVRLLVRANFLIKFLQFRTILGIEHAAFDPKEIEMPDDDPAVLWYICSILHGRDDAFPPDLSPMGILKIAMAAHKYGCTESFQEAGRQWILQGNDVHGLTLEDLGCLMLAAYLFHDAIAFGEVTCFIMVSQRGSLRALAYVPCIFYFLPNIGYAMLDMTEQRDELFHSLRTIEYLGLMDGDKLNAVEMKTCGCLWAVRQGHSQIGLHWEMQAKLAAKQLSVLEYVQHVDEMEEPALVSEEGWCSGEHNVPEYVRLHQQRVHQLVPRSGLDLQAYL